MEICPMSSSEGLQDLSAYFFAYFFSVSACQALSDTLC